MNDEQSSSNGTNRLTIGNGDYYFKIGTVFLASMESPTQEQIENLRNNRISLGEEAAKHGWTGTDEVTP